MWNNAQCVCDWTKIEILFGGEFRFFANDTPVISNGATALIMYQDNQSAILLEKNGTKSSSKRTRHLNIRYFFIVDKIKNNELKVEYCPTDEMVGDFFTKPLQGKKFQDFCHVILNLHVE